MPAYLIKVITISDIPVYVVYAGKTEGQAVQDLREYFENVGAIGQDLQSYAIKSFVGGAPLEPLPNLPIASATLNIKEIFSRVHPGGRGAVA